MSTSEPANVVDEYCINAWSGPRCLSTSLMYSFAQRADTKVLDEPLYAHYLNLTGAPRPYRDLVMQAQNTNGREVVEGILGARTSKVLYAKHMAKQRLALGPDVIRRAAHILLIREPRLLIPSFAKVAPPTLEETCLPELCCIFSELRALGRTPIVVLSEDLQRNPQATLRAICASLNLEWDSSMLSWEPGPRPEDGVWAPWWYKTTHASSGFAESTGPEYRELTTEMHALVEDCQPFYQMLQRNALTPLFDPEPPIKRARLAGGVKPEAAGTHTYAPDARNNSVFIGVRDGVTGRFSLVPRTHAKVSVYDSCFLLGDGMWEGIRVHKGVLAFKQEHIDRLYENLKAVDMDLGMTKSELTEMVYRTVDGNGMRDYIHVRLMVSRGLKCTPYQNPKLTIGLPTVVIIAEHKKPNPEAAEKGCKLFTCHVRRGGPDVQDPNWNSHSKLNCVAACIQANKVGADESLMLDPHGFVATCNSVNFFCIRRGEVWAPTTKYQMAGITRSNILQLCRENGIPSREHDFYLTSVYGADEAFTTGTFGGVVPVVEVDGRTIGDGMRGPITERLQQLYRQLMDKNVSAGR